MGRTSIPCSDSTHDRLASQKRATETWDDCLTRLADDTADTGNADANLEDVFTELRQLSEQMDTVAEDSLTVNAVREAVRIEVRNQLEEFRQ